MESSRRGLLNDMAKHWSIVKNNENTYSTTSLFFKIDLCSATSMESSRQGLLNDMPDRRSILENNEITRYFLSFQDRPMFSHINGKFAEAF